MPLSRPHSLSPLSAVDDVKGGRMRSGTMVIESFFIDVPEGNTKDEICFFVEALINCNLKSLANVSEILLCSNGSSQ
ncbi:hypothetical protein Droror1_Dr00001270 [Drosera rotundifolia]